MRCYAAMLVASAAVLFSACSPCALARAVDVKSMDGNFATVSSATVNQDEIPPLNCDRVLAWMAGGISNERLTILVQQHGVAFAANVYARELLKKTGASVDLVNAIVRSEGEGATNCSAKLADAVNLVRHNNYKDAEPILRALLEGVSPQKDPAASALHFALGYVRQQQGDWDEAFDEYSDAKALMPAFPETHSRLAYDFYISHDGDNTIAEARTALSLDPRNAEAYRDLGLGLYADGKYDAAVFALQQSITLGPDNSDAYFAMGLALRAQHKPGKAIAAYRRVLNLNAASLNGEAGRAHDEIGHVLLEQKKMDEAIREFKIAKRISPNEPSIQADLGDAYFENRDYDAAILELRTLFRVHPDWKVGHSCLAEALMAKHDYEAALPEFRLALHEDPTAALRHQALGEALLLAHHNHEALQELRTAISLNPDSASAHHALGTAFYGDKQWDQALTEFQQALRLHPSAQNYYSLAACLMSLGQYSAALNELNMAMALNPKEDVYRSRKQELIRLMKASDSAAREISSVISGTSIPNASASGASAVNSQK